MKRPRSKQISQKRKNPSSGFSQTNDAQNPLPNNNNNKRYFKRRVAEYEKLVDSGMLSYGKENPPEAILSHGAIHRYEDTRKSMWLNRPLIGSRSNQKQGEEDHTPFVQRQLTPEGQAAFDNAVGKMFGLIKKRREANMTPASRHHQQDRDIAQEKKTLENILRERDLGHGDPKQHTCCFALLSCASLLSWSDQQQQQEKTSEKQRLLLQEARTIAKEWHERFLERHTIKKQQWSERLSFMRLRHREALESLMKRPWFNAFDLRLGRIHSLIDSDTDFLVSHHPDQGSDQTNDPFVLGPVAILLQNKLAGSFDSIALADGTFWKRFSSSPSSCDRQARGYQAAFSRLNDITQAIQKGSHAIPTAFVLELDEPFSLRASIHFAIRGSPRHLFAFVLKLGIMNLDSFQNGLLFDVPHQLIGSFYYPCPCT